MRSINNHIIITKRILSRRRNEYSTKMSPERIQKLFNNVDECTRRISPANCSKNILATCSDIDKEIEQARKKSIFSPLSIRETQVSSVLSKRSITNREKLVTLTKDSSSLSISSTNSPISSFRSSIKTQNSSKLVITKAKNSLSRGKYLEPLNKNKKIRASLMKTTKNNKFQIKISKIVLIVEKCAQVKREWKELFGLYDKMIRQIEEFKRQILDIVENAIGKRREMKLVKETWGYFKPIKNNVELDLKIAKALKRGKTMWKLHHISFTNYLDKLIHSVQARKIS